MADSKKHRDGRTDRQTLASYSFMRANLKAKNPITVRCRPDFAPQLRIIVSMVEGEAPGAMALQISCAAYHVGQTVSSCLAKGKHGVHLRRAPCRKVAGQHGDCKQK